MNKREARLERKAKRLLGQKEKSARLRERPLPEKKIRLGADPGSIFQMNMRWSCDDPDCEGSWSWGTSRQWNRQTWEKSILPKLNEWSRLPWSEIDKFSSGTGHKMHHQMPTEVIVDEATYRLIAIEKYHENIFRFRLGNRQRLWGIRIVDEFQIIWFDPCHEIYPTEPD